MIDLPFRPDRTRPEPVHRQLEHYLRDLIETGRLGAGHKLPATRELANALALSRTTIAQAYDDLVAAGLLTAHVGQGTFVATQRGTPTAAPPADRLCLSFAALPPPRIADGVALLGDIVRRQTLGRRRAG